MKVQTAEELICSIIKEAKLPQYRKKQFLAALEAIRSNRENLESALRDLLAVIREDELVPDSVSYMQNADAALAASVKA